MKRICALCLVLLLTAACVPSPAEDAERDPSHLTVGNPTPMRGEFFTDLWGNATSDIDVRDLLHGYNLIMWDGEQGMFTADPSVVSGLAVEDSEAGDRTFTFALQDDLYYSDGSKITAWDYAFSYLFCMSPILAEIGASPLRREQMEGYLAYMESGGRGPLRGVRIYSDNVFSVTLNHEYLPFFYEMGLLLCNPYPIRVIAPGVRVADEGEGVFLTNEDPEETEFLFTAELLRETVMNPDTGYLSHPSVVSGPYVLTAWDGKTADFAINPYYKGNANGEKPSIETLTYTLALNDTMIDQLVSGEFDLLNKVMRADQINVGLVDMGESDISFSNYPRIGLCYVSFACEKPTVSSPAVRQAIAWCMNRDAITEAYTGFFGQRVDGWYGIGQWMYGIIAGTIAPPVEVPEDENDTQAQSAYTAAIAAFEKLSLEGLTDYETDLARAAALLDADGWTLNEQGIRERDGVTLSLRLIYPEGNNIPDTLDQYFVQPLAAVGIRLTMEAVPMQELLSRWYQQTERQDDMIYLATNFYEVFDPSVHFAADGSWIYTNLVDAPLYEAAVAMRKTEPGDVLTYMQNWVTFQERFNEILPMIPIYSNIYFDFYRDDLQDYNIAQSITWGQAIIGAWLGEAAEEEAEDDGMTFIE